MGPLAAQMKALLQDELRDIKDHQSSMQTQIKDMQKEKPAEVEGEARER